MKKYKTEEERLQARRESRKRWLEKNPNYMKDYSKQYKVEKKEELAEYRKQYYQKHKQVINQNNKEYYESHKSHLAQCGKEWVKNNKEKVKVILQKYRNTPMGRAIMLNSNYIKADENMGRGKGDLTPKWIVENIFSKPCVHCGKKGWKIIGCNRLDNTKPHTKDNVEPCCFECNLALQNNKRNELGRFIKS